jgi:hypothetical protein
MMQKILPTPYERVYPCRMMVKRFSKRVIVAVGLALVMMSGCGAKQLQTLRQDRPSPPILAVPIPGSVVDLSREIRIARRPVDRRIPKTIPSTQPQPCVFRGSVYAQGWLYPKAVGGKALAYFHDFPAIELERLELPDTLDARIKIIVKSPIRIEGYLSEQTHLVQLTKRIDVVPTHIWYQPGTPVKALASSEGMADVPMKLPSGMTPSTFQTSVPCTDLALNVQSYLNYLSVHDDQSVFIGRQPVSLHASPAGPVVATIVNPYRQNDYFPFLVLEKKPGWYHVTGNYLSSLVFDGWMSEKELLSRQNLNQEFGMIGLIGDNLITHQVVSPIPLRLEANDAAPIVATAAVGAEILIEPGPPGYRAITFGMSIQANNEKKAFYARESTLGRAVELADCVEDAAANPNPLALPEEVVDSPCPKNDAPNNSKTAD